MQEKYAQLALENTVRLLGIDSPSGYTENAAKYVQAQFAQMRYDAKITRKGGVLIDLGGEDAQDALLLEAHTDTLGGMVAQIKGNGRLRITNVGGMNANNAEAENVRVITKFSGAIDGTVQLCDASVHVNGNYSTTPRTFDTVEVVLDEDVRSAEDVRKLGIDVGDFGGHGLRRRGRAVHRTASVHLREGLWRAVQLRCRAEADCRRQARRGGLCGGCVSALRVGCGSDPAGGV